MVKAIFLFVALPLLLVFAGLALAYKKRGIYVVGMLLANLYFFLMSEGLVYAFNRKLTLWCDVIDVFNVGRQDGYWGYPDRVSGIAKYSTMVKFGISGNF